MRHFVEGPKDSPKTSSVSSVTTATTASDNIASNTEQSSDLPSDEAGRRLALTKKFSYLMDRLQGNIFIASQRINDITGYSGIEALKKQIIDLELRLQELQIAVHSARLKYKSIVSDRASSQREVTTLLARKDSWTPADLERFTALYRMDHSNEQAVQDAATRLADAEKDMEHASSQLRNSILSRYHEEQIWSDKIRRMSTWGTWGLMGVNILLFLVFQLGFEPWRRKRLVQGFEEKVRQAFKQEINFSTIPNTSPDSLPSNLTTTEVLDVDTQAKRCESSADTTVFKEASLNDDIAKTKFFTKLLDNPGFRKLDSHVATLRDLFSDRIIEIRKQEIVIIALESALIGATIVTTIFTPILLRSSF